MTHRVGTKGQVVIPKSMRDAAAIRPGDEVDFDLVEGGVLVRRRSHDSLIGLLRGHDLVGILESDRRADRR